jgi:hypothetical protein
LKTIRAEVRRYNATKDNSLLKPPTLDNMESFTWADSQEEVQAQMPTLNHAITGALTKSKQDEDNIKWY